MHGLLNLNKPAGATSRDVVNQIQRLVRPAKVGHAGTLDPLATGVLVVGIGAATRLMEYVQRLPKKYRATFLMGHRSDTDDVEGNVTEVDGAPRLTYDEINAALPQFIGNISQRPPAYSAIKVQGRRSYDLARKGEPVTLAERTVTIHSLELFALKDQMFFLDVECGSGTYIRSLGRDIAESLRSSAVMTRLVRTAIGSFQLESAIDPSSLDAINLPGSILPIESAVQALARIELSDEEATGARQGKFISRPGHGIVDDVAALDSRGKLIAVLVPRDGNLLRPEKVIATS